MSKRVLVVDDSIYMRSLIGDALRSAGYEVIGEAVDGKTAIELSETLVPDIITLDNILPDLMGLEILEILREKKIESKILMISAVGQKTMINKGKELGAADYIVKPFDQEVLVEKVRGLFAA
jgi:two-component system chemotaxis response regulator CheY